MCNILQVTGLPALKVASNALRTGFLVLLALRNDGGAETGTQVFRQFVELRVPVNLDGLLGGVADHVAVVTPSQVIFEFGLGAVVDHTVEIIRQLL